MAYPMRTRDIGVYALKSLPEREARLEGVASRVEFLVAGEREEKV
jgi:hypothetical protein